jgi:RNA-directed DNA polymerase
LAAYAAAVGATYTRYADDLTFSGSNLAVRQRGVVAAVARITREEGFSLNVGKTRIRGRDSRQQVTGVVVNQTTRVPRDQYDLLRAILHNCLVHGPESQNRLGHRDFRAHVLGRLAWVAALDAEQGRRLMVTFDRINWA